MSKIFRHDGHFDGKGRSLVAIYQPIMATLPVVSLINYFALNDAGGLPKNLDPDRLLGLLITRALKQKGLAVPPMGAKWKIMMNATSLEPDSTGQCRQFTRKDDEQEVDKELFSLCETLNIKLCHGLSESPEDPNDVVGQRGLTSHGLDSLNNEIEEEELALLFRNGYLDVIHKKNGSLFLLKTTAEQGESMWILLTVHESHKVLLNHTFHPLDLTLQPNAKEEAVVEFINKWNEAREKATRDFIQEEEAKEQREKEQRAKRRASKQKKAVDDVQDHGSISDNKESATPEGSKVPVRKDDLDEYKWIKVLFRRFLEEYVDPEDESTEEMAFYKRMVLGWANLQAKHRPSCVPIYYPHILAFDEALALAIHNHSTRLHDLLSQVFLEFRVDNHCGKKEQLKGKVKLRLLSMPPDDGSTRSFKDFLDSSKTKLVQPHALYDGTTLKEINYIGRIAGKGYVDDLLEYHRDGKSFDGNISKPNLVIKGGKFHILRSADMVAATIQSMQADFIKLTEILFEFYGEAPPYLHAFQSEIILMGDYDINTREFKVFQKYLSHHLAFKAPLVRAGLFIDMWCVIQSLRRKDEVTGKRDPFPKLQASWLRDNQKTYAGFFQKGWFFKAVYDFDNPRSGRYCDYLQVELLELIRHLEMHLPDHTRDNGNQLLPDIMLVDLMVEVTFYEYSSKLVYSMMLELNDAAFCSAWRRYEMFECSDELENTVSESGNVKNVQSGGMDNSTSGNEEAKNSGPGTRETRGSLPSGVGSGSEPPA